MEITLKRFGLALLAILFVAAGSWLSGVVGTLGDDKAHFATLQGLEFSHRGQLKSEDLPKIITPSEGLGAGEAFLVLEDPLRSGSAIWVALDRLQIEGTLFSVPGTVPMHLRCEDLGTLEVDRVASARVSKKLYSSCVN